MYMAIIARHGDPRPARDAVPGESVVIRTSIDMIRANHLPVARGLDLILLEGFDLSDLDRSDALLMFNDVRASTPIVRIDRA
jgi:hypothetical protein